jgi:hypothetical protein
MNLVSRIIPGALNNANKDAIDWNYHGLLAYGCQSSVVVLDPRSFRVYDIFFVGEKKMINITYGFIGSSMYGKIS